RDRKRRFPNGGGGSFLAPFTRYSGGQGRQSSSGTYFRIAVLDVARPRGQGSASLRRFSQWRRELRFFRIFGTKPRACGGHGNCGNRRHSGWRSENGRKTA